MSRKSARADQAGPKESKTDSSAPASTPEGAKPEEPKLAEGGFERVCQWQDGRRDHTRNMSAKRRVGGVFTVNLTSNQEEGVWRGEGRSLDEACDAALAEYESREIPEEDGAA